MGGLTTRIGLAAAAGIAALAALGATLWFLGDALKLCLEANGWSPAGAAGLTGVSGLVLALLLGLLARLAMRPSRCPPAPCVGGVANGIAADLGALVAQQIVNSTRAHPYSTMGAALAAGVALGAVPELRKSIFGLFK